MEVGLGSTERLLVGVFGCLKALGWLGEDIGR